MGAHYVEYMSYFTHLSLSPNTIFLLSPPSQFHFSVEYKEGCKEDDPKCLFQVQVPQSFLTLQEKVRECVAKYKEDNKIPIMEEGEFRSVIIVLYYSTVYVGVWCTCHQLSCLGSSVSRSIIWSRMQSIVGLSPT